MKVSQRRRRGKRAVLEKKRDRKTSPPGLVLIDENGDKPKENGVQLTKRG